MHPRLGVPVAAAALTLLLAAPAFAAVSPSPAPSSRTTGPVVAAVQSGARLYIGGKFTAVDGSPAVRLAALDAATGVRDTTFRADVNGEVHALATDGTTVFVGGKFTTVAGVARANLAAVSPSGQVLATFRPNPSSTVEALAYVDGTLYVGGSFASISGVKRRYLAAVDPVTGALRTGFDPRPNALVHALAASGAQVYAGGRFTSMGGVARSYVALLDASGAVQPYDAQLGSDAQVWDIAPMGTAVYLATGGHIPNGNSVYRTAIGTGERQWQVKVDGDVEAVAAEGEEVYGGGHFTVACLPASDATTGCLPDFSARKGVTIDAATGAPRPFATFNSTFGIRALTTAGGNLYALGEFTQVNGLSRAGIARFPVQ